MVFVFRLSPILTLNYTAIAGRIDQDQFISYWNNFMSEDKIELANATLADDETLRTRNIFVVGKNQNKVYLSMQLPPTQNIMCEALEDGTKIMFTFRCSKQAIVQFLKPQLRSLFTTK